VGHNVEADHPATAPFKLQRRPARPDNGQVAFREWRVVLPHQHPCAGRGGDGVDLHGRMPRLLADHRHVRTKARDHPIRCCPGGEILLSAAEALTPVSDPSRATDALPIASVPLSASVPDFDVHALVEPEFWGRIPADVPELLSLLPKADLYVQDEVDVRHHPTLMRVWSRKGRAGQRLVRAPGISLKAVGFAAVDWRDGWCSWGFAPGRTARPFVHQLDHLVERSQGRGRIAIVLLDNARIHTPQGGEGRPGGGGTPRGQAAPCPDPGVRPAGQPRGASLPAIPPGGDAQPPPGRRRRSLPRRLPLYFEDLDLRPERALRHLGSPFAIRAEAACSAG
jgi:hypothetical protein